jgi:hypothetical protein
MGLLCKNCEADFEPKRIDQIFCCSRCRVQFHNWQYQLSSKPFKEAVRNLKEQDYNLAVMYIEGDENAIIRRSQFRELGIETKYAKSIKKDGAKTLEYNFVRFGLKSIGILEYQVYKINS